MLEYASVTDCGNRSVNEDSIGVRQKENYSCFILCDGLGGHGMGDVASSLVRDEILNLFEENDKIEKFLGIAFQQSQEKLMAEQVTQNAKSKMKTTAVCMISEGKKVHVGHIGDSRFYAFSKNQVKIQSKDHSVPYMLYLAKEIKENEIRNHPDRSMLLRVMGTQWKDNMYELMKPFSLKKYQAFLLCSDGFWELITEDKMCELLNLSTTAEEWLNAMLDVVRENGKDVDMDNYSAIAILNK